MVRVTNGNCYFFAGGATGGHLTPGLALAAELVEHNPECRIVFVGSDRPLERRLVAEAGYEHHALPVESTATIRRQPLRFVWRNWRAFCMAQQLLENNRPAAVIGLGGFASVPAILAASRRRVPTLILEQNVVPGRATRLLCRRVGAVCTAFEATTSKLASGSRVVVTGNPVRGAIAALWRPGPVRIPVATPTLLVLGGSQGAASLNEAVMEMLTRQLQKLAAWQIVHQTGPERSSEIADAYRSARLECIVQPFFDDLSGLYSQATLVIARAGATTLAELACAGCPAVLLPYPHAADDHQLANARLYESAGAAVVVEHEPSPTRTTAHLAETIDALTADTARLTAMRKAMQGLARPDAAANVVAVLQSLAVDSIT